jgi:peptide-methionine (S)-S-oxide reductase
MSNIANRTNRAQMRVRTIARIAAAAFVLGTAACGRIGAVEPATLVPPPAADEQKSSATSEKAVLAGGCFWGVQGVFQHV